MTGSGNADPLQFWTSCTLTKIKHNCNMAIFTGQKWMMYAASGSLPTAFVLMLIQQ